MNDLPKRNVLSLKVFLVLFVFVTSLFLLNYFDATGHLLFGWLYFPLRTLSRMTVEWGELFLGLCCTLLFVIGLHRTARWFRRSIETDAVPTQATSWSWSTTFVVTSLLLVLFAAGTALVGATHQSLWLITGRPERDSERTQADWIGFRSAYRSAVYRIQASNQLKMFGIGMHSFHDTYDAFPLGGTFNQQGEPLHGWAAFSGPYYGYLNDNIDFYRPWNRPPNDRIYRCQLIDFLNPGISGSEFDEQGFGLCHYAGNIHVLTLQTVAPESEHGPRHHLGFSPQDSISLSEITDGPGNTILIGTVAEQFEPWGSPLNVRDPGLGINQSPHGFGGPPQSHGALFLMCDGSVRYLPETTDPKILQALATPAGGEELPKDFWTN